MILGASFYAVAASLVNLVGDYLFQTKVSTETAKATELAIRFAPLFSRGEADTLYNQALEAARDAGGRILLIDRDGKVQIDSFTVFNGWRFSHREVVSVLNGRASDYGFHMQDGVPAARQRAFFDFLRNTDTGKEWVGYYTAALESGGETIGVMLYSVSVQDLADNLRVIQDQMLLFFIGIAVAVIALSILFSRIITRPIAALTEGIKRMASGDFSSRVRVGGIDEMGRLAGTFNQMSEKLENVDNSRNEFVSNASHELKTPLATMKILLESILYQENMEPALRTEFLTDINKELDRLSAIVTDLLTLTRTDTQDYQLQRTDVQLRELVRETLRRLEPLAAENGQTVEFKAAAEVPIFADPGKLQQIVYNLVENALKYSPKGGKVRVALRQDAKNALLEIADNGPGIPKKDQPHIFERFYRVDRARARATGGNGLGLSIVHQAVMLHGGSVSVESEEGKGATFRVELPL